jgi:GNAT superfamily N-acetyltransferase
MIIKNLNEVSLEDFKEFKTIEWKKADDDHYGDNPPNFAVFEQTFVAEADGELIGQIELKIDQGVAKIESLLVGSEQQGRGIGRELVITGEAWVIQNGAHKITLETGESWKAKKFYEKLGYEVRAVLPNDVAHQNFVLMDKMLVVTNC